MRFQSLAASLLALAVGTQAITIPAEAGELVRRQSSTSTASATSTKVSDSACTNGPLTRSCWGGGYSIATDFDQKHPNTGKTVSYNLEITNTTCNPDGNGARICLLVNGQYPGPTITASWGDTLSITVKNSMKDNGTGIHWHGIRQFNTNEYDGVNGITECPLAPGDTKTYTFLCTQFGTSWYHSHFSAQYGDGVVGSIVINGPASSNYDIDLGPYPITDWYYRSAYQINADTLTALQAGGPGPGGDNILINGTNRNVANTTGKYATTKVTKGKKYRLRLINTSLDNDIRVSLDGHSLTVMTTDFVPVKPFSTNTILLAIGQRYDVVIYANQTAGNYWLRAQVATDCQSANSGIGYAIFNYDSVAVANPSSTAWPTPSTGCFDPTSAAPFWRQPVPSTSAFNDLNVILTNGSVSNGAGLTVWGLNTTSIDVSWDKPIRTYMQDGNTSYPSSENVITLPNAGVWTYWLIQEVQRTPQIVHPIHLHGHDFFVLGASGDNNQNPNTATTVTFDPSSDPAKLDWTTPIRRDTAILPQGGWLALAFYTNNPGPWLFHCHIAWHVSEGLGLDFIESPDQVPAPSGDYSKTCTNWNKYAPNAYWKKDDSGL
ncbi:MAG: hypothetical protein M1820_000304 [Bogoriella megaspora]|nr:MAG: hypothetical protein M1820_000304 [Bogoriella megaspora]